MEVYNTNSKKLLLLSAPCTGSTSRLLTCRRFMGHNDNKNMDQYCIKSQHSTLDELSKIINLDEYYIAFFVRNPYERVMSHFTRSYIRGNNLNEQVVLDKLKSYIKNKTYITLKLQSNLLKINDELQSINKIGYYGSMDKDWEIICDECSLPIEQLKIIKPKEITDNKLRQYRMHYERTSKYRYDNRLSYNHYLDLDTKKELYEFFKEDFDNFDYDPDL